MIRWVVHVGVLDSSSSRNIAARDFAELEDPEPGKIRLAPLETHILSLGSWSQLRGE